jgi:hypothetical protein
MNNIDLDDYVSLAISFREDKNYAGETLNTMKFHFADDNFGVKWYPTKKAIGKLITVLKELEGQMTDDTNAESNDE